jgi:hypothetical protein
MKLHFEFDNINCGPNNRVPVIDLRLNQQTLYYGPVVCELDLNSVDDPTSCLEIVFVNKDPSDTVCDTNGTITSDMNFCLKKIVIDNIDFEELIWQSKYVCEDQTYNGCLFFGPKGRFVIDFEYPVLRWMLKTRHSINGLDPNWEEDYNYYVNACKILNNL